MELTPRARWALESVAPERGVIFSGFSYFKTFRKAAASIIGEERATYLALRDLRHATITELAEHTGNLAAVAGHKDLRTTSRYFHASTKAASQALRARTAADAKLEIVTPIAEMKAQTVTVTVTGCRDGEGEIEKPRLSQQGRVAQLDRALPSGARSPDPQTQVMRLFPGQSDTGETPEGTAKPQWIPLEAVPYRVETDAAAAATEALASAALAYFANPSPELLEVCQAACAVVVAARRAKVG